MSADFISAWDPGEAGSPVFLLLHGTGGDERDLMPLAEAIRPGAGRLGLRGKVSENGANRWFRRFAEGVFDLEDMAHRTQELSAYLSGINEEFDLGERPLVALGYSNGANMAAQLLLTGFPGLAGAILLRPMVTSQPEGEGLAPIPVLIASGSSDAICPPGEGEELGQMLSRQGRRVQFELLPAGHNLTKGDVALSQAFMAEHF